jgi:hypothetical protein
LEAEEKNKNKGKEFSSNFPKICTFPRPTSPASDFVDVFCWFFVRGKSKCNYHTLTVMFTAFVPPPVVMRIHLRRCWSITTKKAKYVIKIPLRPKKHDVFGSTARGVGNQ